MAAGVLMILLGLFLVMRTVTKDGQGHNLVDKLTSL